MKKISYILIYFLLLAIATEAAARIATSLLIVYDIEMTRYAEELKIPAGKSGWRFIHRPSAQANLMGVSIRTNRLGLRGPELKPGGKKVLLLGDSLTLGWGVEEPDTFFHLISEGLREQFGAEAINGGHGNYNTRQEADFLFSFSDQLRPSAVVLFYFLNDAELGQFKKDRAWMGHSRFLSLAWSAARKSRLLAVDTEMDYQAYYQALYQPDQVGWQGAKLALKEIRDFCLARRIPFSVVLLPDFHTFDPYPFQKQHDLIADTLRILEIPYLDLAPAFAGVKDARNLWVAPDDPHPNGIAHRKIADLSFAFIKAAL